MFQFDSRQPRVQHRRELSTEPVLMSADGEERNLIDFGDETDENCNVDVKWDSERRRRSDVVDADVYEEIKEPEVLEAVLNGDVEKRRCPDDDVDFDVYEEAVSYDESKKAVHGDNDENKMVAYGDDDGNKMAAQKHDNDEMECDDGRYANYDDLNYVDVKTTMKINVRCENSSEFGEENQFGVDNDDDEANDDLPRDKHAPGAGCDKGCNGEPNDFPATRSRGKEKLDDMANAIHIGLTGAGVDDYRGPLAASYRSTDAFPPTPPGSISSDNEVLDAASEDDDRRAQGQLSPEADGRLNDEVDGESLEIVDMINSYFYTRYRRCGPIFNFI